MTLQSNNIYTVYALVSEVDGRIYVGFTSNFEKRIKEHNAGIEFINSFFLEYS